MIDWIRGNWVIVLLSVLLLLTVWLVILLA